MKKVIKNMVYSSSLTNLCEINSSFDTGVLRIAYSGLNRNNSFISKESFENCIKTIYNCPIVCNYDRDTDTLGGHDVEVVKEDNGDIRLVNITTPVGVIPESAKYWWGKVEEDDGSENEYLYTEVLLWKRQEAYKKIKEDGITAHSMEISVKDGEVIDGVYYIKDFEFTAFALIGVEPCFESSALETFSKDTFKDMLSEMMKDLKETTQKFLLADTSNEVEDIHPQNYSTEGGEKVLKDDVVINEAELENSEEISKEEEFEAEPTESIPEEAVVESEENPEDNSEESTDTFALDSAIHEELDRFFETIKIEREWGMANRYWICDYDFDAKEVFCWDTEDWMLYGFTFAINGDSIEVDLESKKRKKYTIVDFNDGDQQSSPFIDTFKAMEDKIADNSEWETKYQTASDTIASMEKELGELRQFKTDTETAIAQGERDKVFAQFEDLIGVEAFDELRENAANYEVDALEEKCYALRGRLGINAKFNFENKAPKIVVEKIDVSEEPYGGLISQYAEK